MNENETAKSPFANPWVKIAIVLVVLLLLPLTGYLAIRFLEESDKFLGGLRALAFFLVRRKFFVRLLASRPTAQATLPPPGRARL